MLNWIVGGLVALLFVYLGIAVEKMWAKRHTSGVRLDVNASPRALREFEIRRTG